jgi:uncharacterized membrane protein YjjB (DUF3815 family)
VIVGLFGLRWVIGWPRLRDPLEDLARSPVEARGQPPASPVGDEPEREPHADGNRRAGEVVQAVRLGEQDLDDGDDDRDLLEIAVGIVIAAEVSGVGTASLFEATVPRGLPYWLIVISWVPFVFGMALTFSARMRDIPWILVLTYLAWGVQFGATKWVGPDAGTFIAAGLLAAAAGFLELSPSRPPRIVLILGGFFALTVGSVALRGLTTLDGGHSIQGFGDLRDAITQTAAITLGLIVGAVPVQAAAVRRRRLAAGKSLAT